MHAGNARTALLAWLDARARRGRMLLRIEDLDSDRCRPEFADGIRQDLRWLGLDWDAETAPQSQRDAVYGDAIVRLERDGRIYECFCTRRELAIATAPHGRRGSPPCPRGCRDLDEQQREALRAEGRRAALRVRMPGGAVTVDDRVRGRVTVDAVGDPVVRRADGLYAYQLAVVVDDAADGVTEVLRGDDLLPSTGVQIGLAGLLGLPQVAYAHVPLVLGADRARLAKRHGAVTIAELRSAGVSAGALVGRMAASCGAGNGAPAMPADLAARFDLARISRDPWVLREPMFDPPPPV
jgi:glutamyl-tRNA synthetase